MNEDVLRQLANDRRQELEREAEAERIALHARRRRIHRASEHATTPAAARAFLLAARRHAAR
jgi:hypothetical protein